MLKLRGQTAVFVQHLLAKICIFIIEKYNSTIQKILPEKDDYGKKLDVPIDLELRQFSFNLKSQ